MIAEAWRFFLKAVVWIGLSGILVLIAMIIGIFIFAIAKGALEVFLKKSEKTP